MECRRYEKPEDKKCFKDFDVDGCNSRHFIFGLSVLAQKIQPIKDHEGEIKITVLAQMAEQVYGGRNIFSTSRSLQLSEF